MTALSDTLTTTGVIATLISILFAVASMIISRRRKMHEAMTVAPEAAPSAAPAPAAAREPLPQLTAETRSTSSPLFKRLGRVGIEPTEATTGHGEQMVWE